MIYFRRPLKTCHPSGVQEVLSTVFYTHSAPLGLLPSQISTILLIGHAKLTLINSVYDVKFLKFFLRNK